MRFVPRFLADGRAVALDGYIHRVNDSVIRRTLPVPSASATMGGSAEFRQGPFAFRHEEGADPVVSFRSSSVRTWHERRDVGDGSAGATHTVRSVSRIEGLSVGDRLSLDRAVASLEATYTTGDAEPAIKPVDAGLDGLVIDGVRFTVTLNTEPAARYCTCREFHDASAHDEEFKQTNGHRLLSLRGDANGSPAKGCFVYSVVERLDWDGALPAGAEVDQDSHVIVWPDFGKIILGEMLIADYSRRLTMLRLELGSPLEGSLSAADIQSGGQGLP